jgi:hypothetical protein
MREQFEHAPSVTYILEATTPKSRDVYSHYGWEVNTHTYSLHEKAY